MRRSRPHWLLLAVVAASLFGTLGLRSPQANEELQVSMGGIRLALEDGLTRVSGGDLEITKRDLVAGFGVDVRQLIPRPAAKRRRRRKPAIWVLCYGEASGRYAGDARAAARGSFSLTAVARIFGWKIHQQGALVEIADSGKVKSRRGGRPGDRIPDLELPGLDGKRRSIRALRGQRVLVVLWSPWSKSRNTLNTWAAEWGLRKDKNLALVLVAVDLEGAERVRSYLPPGMEGHVVLDRNGVTPALFGARQGAGFTIIDDLGLVRGTGTEPTTVDLSWLDAHLREPARAPSSDERHTPAGTTLAALRAAVKKRPGKAEGHLALGRALEASDPAAALIQYQAAFKRKPAGATIALTLARMLLDGGDRPGAMTVLDTARRTAPRTLALRRQYWALEHPSRFYDGEIDFPWQRATRKAEDKAWGHVRVKRK